MRSVQRTLDELTSCRYLTAWISANYLPDIWKEQEALEELRSLQHGGIIVKEKHLDPSPLSREDSWTWKEEWGLPLFGWVFVLVLVPVIVLLLFRWGLYWEYLQISPWCIDWILLWGWVYGRKGLVLEGLIWLLLTPLSLILTRVTIFVFTHLFFTRGLWIFPNLLLDDDFFTIFSPVFEWDRNPKDSLRLRWRQFRNRMRAELGMEDKHRKNRKRKISPRALRKAITSGKEK
jgi:hypothetical protein